MITSYAEIFKRYDLKAVLVCLAGTPPMSPDQLIPIFEQYTGFKDMEGKEIYEGDIFRINQAHEDFGPAPNYGTIEWRGDGWIITDCDLKPMWYQAELGAHYDQIVVVGNIHENQEILRLRKE